VITPVEETSYKYSPIYYFMVIAAAAIVAYLKMTSKQGDFEKVKVATGFAPFVKKTFQEDLLNSKDSFERVL
jgi:hypothetical protein